MKFVVWCITNCFIFRYLYRGVPVSFPSPTFCRPPLMSCIGFVRETQQLHYFTNICKDTFVSVTQSWWEIHFKDCEQNPPTFLGVMELSLAKSDPRVTLRGAMICCPSVHRKGEESRQRSEGGLYLMIAVIFTEMRKNRGHCVTVAPWDEVFICVWGRLNPCREKDAGRMLN